MRAIWLMSLATLAQPPFGFGPPMGGEQKIVKDHDKDGDGRLNKEERAEARKALAAQPRRGPFGPGGFRGPGGPPPGGGPPRGERPPGGRGGFGPPMFMRMGPGTPGKKLTPNEVTPYGKESLYDIKTLRTLFLEFDTPEWEAEMADFNNTDVELPVVLTVDGKRYNDVGVHFRGASSFMMVPAGRKRSLNVSLDWVNKDQRLLGYRTLNLLNSNGDPTMMRYALYAEIAKHFVPMPKANFVRVVLNGENWGIYPNVQQFNADFVKENFKATGGARWKVPGSPRGRGGLAYLGGNVADYKRIYEIKTKDDAKSWAAFIHLTRVLNETPADRLETALAPILDVDGALKFLALENVLINSDGYWTRASDYNIYMEPSGKFHVIPHDVNESFRTPEGPGARGGVDLDIFAGMDDPEKVLLHRLLAVPALKARYVGYVRTITEDWLDWKKLAPVVIGWRSLLEADVKMETRMLGRPEDFLQGIDGEPEHGMSLKQFVEQRRAYLLGRDDVRKATRP